MLSTQTDIKIFDWEKCHHSEPMVVFLKSVQGTGIDEEKFIEGYIKVEYLKATGRSRRRCRSFARSEYRALDTKFDFFELCKNGAAPHNFVEGEENIKCSRCGAISKE